MRSVDQEYGFVPRRSPQNLFIRGGQIHCPARGEVGLEVCLVCRHMRGLAGDGDGAVVCDSHADIPIPFDPGVPRGWTGRSRR